MSNLELSNSKIKISSILALLILLAGFAFWSQAKNSIKSKSTTLNQHDSIHLEPANTNSPNSTKKPATLADNSSQKNSKPTKSNSRSKTTQIQPAKLSLHTELEFLKRLRKLGISTDSFFDLSHKNEVQESELGILVLNPEEEAIANAKLTLVRSRENIANRNSTGGSTASSQLKSESNERGFTRIEAIPAGNWHLTVEATNYVSMYFASIKIKAGEDNFIEVQLQRSQSNISGHVFDVNDSPLQGARMTSSRSIEGGPPIQSTATTNYDGYYSLSVLEGSQSKITAQKDGFKDASLANIIAGASNIDFNLEEAQTIEVFGRLVDGITEAAVTEFTVDSVDQSNPNGNFSLQKNLKPSRQQITVSADGYIPHVIEFTSQPDGVDLGEVRLFTESGLYGLVLIEGREGRAPAAEVTVHLKREGNTTLSSTTNDQGGFSFLDLSANSVEIQVSAAGVAPYSKILQIPDAESVYIEIILLAGEFKVLGYVFEEESGDPISGATIQIVEHPEQSVESEADGSYILPNIPYSNFHLRVSKAAYFSKTSPTIQLSPDVPTGHFIARLTSGGIGAYLSIAGVPAPQGIEVILWKASSSELPALLEAQASLAENKFSQQTDENGVVSFEVPDGTYFMQVPAYRLHPMQVESDSQDPEWLEVELPGSTRLSGRLTNSDGSPLANTSIWLHSGDNDYSTMFLYHTNSSGRFTIPNLSAKAYALSIIKSLADQSAQHLRILNASGAPEQSLDIQLPPLTASISGRLTDENGNGKANVMIGAEYLDAPHRSILAGWVGTDSNGYYEIPRLEGGRHMIRTAWTEDEVVFSEPTLLEPGEHAQVNLVAPNVRGKHVRGYMKARDGGPIGGNFVFAVDSQGRQSGNFFSTMAWAYAGSFDIKGLKAGTYDLLFTAMGCNKKSVQINVQDDVDGLIVEMDRELP